MIVIFDTCVILDVLLDRKPFSEDANILFNLVSIDKIKGLITVESFMDIHYIVKNRTNDEKITRNILKKITELFEIVDSLSYDCLKAIDSNINDYEDAFLAQSAKTLNADYIVTRNIKDFKNGNQEVILPKDLVKLINSI